MLLFANKARSTITNSVTSAAGQVATVTTATGALFVGVGGVATSATNPMRCVITGVDANGNDTGAFEIVEIVRSSDNLTLQSRGLEGTTAAAWSAGAVIECRPTADGAAKGSRVLFAGGPLADVSSGISSYAAMTVPAGLLLPGDMIRVSAMWYHKSGAYTYAPRTGFSFNGSDVVPVTSVWSAPEHTLWTEGFIAIQSSTVAFVAGRSSRENGVFTGSGAQGTITVATGSSMDLLFSYRFDSTGETICLATYCVELVRG